MNKILNNELMVCTHTPCTQVLHNSESKKINKYYVSIHKRAILCEKSINKFFLGDAHQPCAVIKSFSFNQ